MGIFFHFYFFKDTAKLSVKKDSDRSSSSLGVEWNLQLSPTQHQSQPYLMLHETDPRCPRSPQSSSSEHPQNVTHHPALPHEVTDNQAVRECSEGNTEDKGETGA